MRIPLSLKDRLSTSQVKGKKGKLVILWSWLASKFSLIFRRNQNSPKEVLFFGNSRVMVKHQLRFYEILKQEIPDASFRIVLFGMDKTTTLAVRNNCENKGLFTVNLWQVPWRWWDLCVIADHTYQNEFVPNDTPVLFIYHGLGSIKLVKGENYKYGDPFVLNQYGNLKYDVMFEAGEFQKNYAVTLSPKLQPVLKVVGDLEVDSFLVQCKQRTEIRKKMNLSDEDVLVLVQSTWDKNSLEQRFGPALFEMCEELNRRLGLRFVFSSHPAHWGGRSDVEDRSDYYLSNESEAVQILRPDEDRHSYMAASDLCVSDITTLSTVYAFSKRPLVFSVGDLSALDQGSELATLIRESPQVETVFQLATEIEKNLNQSSPPTYVHLLKSFCKYPGGGKEQMICVARKLMEMN